LGERFTLYVDDEYPTDVELARQFERSRLEGVVVIATGAPEVPALVGNFTTLVGRTAIGRYLKSATP